MEYRLKIVVEVVGGKPEDPEQRKQIINLIKAETGCNDDIVLCYSEQIPLEQFQKASDAVDSLLKVAKTIEIPTLLPSPSKTEICQGRTDRQRKEQDKLRRRFYNKK